MKTAPNPDSETGPGAPPRPPFKSDTIACLAAPQGGPTPERSAAVICKFAWALVLGLMLCLPARLLADSVQVTITVDNSYGFGFGDVNGIYPGAYYGGVDNNSGGAILGPFCYVFVSPYTPAEQAADNGPEIYTITNAGLNDFIYIVAWSDDSSDEGAVATFTDTSTGATVSTSPTAPAPGWQVYATGINLVHCTNNNNGPLINLVHESTANTLPCPPSYQRGPPLTGYPEAINNQIHLANLSAGPPATSSVGWVNTTGSTFDGSGFAHGRLEFTPGGVLYPYAVPACLAASASPAPQWMEYSPDTNLVPVLNPFQWSTNPPNFLREYLIFRIGPLGQVLGINSCVTITNQSLTCINSNQTYVWSFCVTNFFTNEIQYLSIPDPPAGVTFSEDIIKLPVDLQPGQGTCLSLYVTNQSTNSTFCFLMGAHNTNLILCCSFTNCLSLPPCCASFTAEKMTGIKGQANCYTYQSVVENTTAAPISYAFLVPGPGSCLTFTPDIITLSPPLQPNQSRAITTKVCLTPPCPAPQCFLVSLQNSNLVECCSSTHCLPATTGPIAVASPTDGSIYFTPANIPLAVNLDSNVTFSAVTYLANGQAVASNSAPPFSAIWSNAPAGNYAVSASGVDTLGAVWVSDPVSVYVYDSGTGSQLTQPLLTAVTCVDGGLNFCIQTTPGTTYQVETTSSLSSPGWTVTQTIVGDGSMVTVTNLITSAPQQFFRVRVSK